MQIPLDSSFTQMLGTSVGYPLVRARTQIATFGSNDKIFRIGVEGFCNEQLTYLWSIGVSSIDTEHLCQRGRASSSIAPNARSVAFWAWVSPFTPVIVSRS